MKMSCRGCAAASPCYTMTSLMAGERRRIRGDSCIACSRAKQTERERDVWIHSTNAQIIAASLESFQTPKIVAEEDFRKENSADVNGGESGLESLKSLGQFEVIVLSHDGILREETSKNQLGKVVSVSNAEELSILESQAREIVDENQVLVVKASDWKIIPAENLVANHQKDQSFRLFGWAEDFESSRVLLEALEIGVDGVILSTVEPSDVRKLASYTKQLIEENRQKSSYTVARVTEVRPVGMGDRACIDLAENLVPGEGILVGSFAKGLFLVHSECEESGGWINARPFRVNAGPVHAYVQIPGGKTRYISELQTGDEVLVHDAEGRSRAALIGRMKIEKRPLTLVKAVDSNGEDFAILLQNAETVKLVGPYHDTAQNPNQTWKSISMADIELGDEIFVLCQAGARHTGVAIEESIVER